MRIVATFCDCLFSRAIHTMMDERHRVNSRTIFFTHFLPALKRVDRFLDIFRHILACAALARYEQLLQRMLKAWVRDTPKLQRPVDVDLFERTDVTEIMRVFTGS